MFKQGATSSRLDYRKAWGQLDDDSLNEGPPPAMRLPDAAINTSFIPA